jgi:hypothetical protein
VSLLLVAKLKKEVRGDASKGNRLCCGCAANVTQSCQVSPARSAAYNYQKQCRTVRISKPRTKSNSKTSTLANKRNEEQEIDPKLKLKLKRKWKWEWKWKRK